MSRKMDIKNKSFISKHIIVESPLKYQGKHINRIYMQSKMYNVLYVYNYHFPFIKSLENLIAVLEVIS